MSRIGSKPVIIPEDVKVNLSPEVVEVSSPKGVLKVDIHPNSKIEISDSKIIVNRKDDTKLSKSVHGLMRSLINNAVIGVTEGFKKELEVVGVGYRASVADNKLTLKVGFSHDVIMEIPEGLELEVKKNIISVSGIDKQLVGQMAANIRKVRKPEPYKGKGIKYTDEIVRRKVGKAVKSTTGVGA